MNFIVNFVETTCTVIEGDGQLEVCVNFISSAGIVSGHSEHIFLYVTSVVLRSLCVCVTLVCRLSVHVMGLCLLSVIVTVAMVFLIVALYVACPVCTSSCVLVVLFHTL